MRILTRFEFIGLQDGETVSGHKYAHNQREVDAYLAENHVTDVYIGYAGFVPEEFVLPHYAVKAVFDSFGKRTALLHAFNQMALEGLL